MQLESLFRRIDDLSRFWGSLSPIIASKMDIASIVSHVLWGACSWDDIVSGKYPQLTLLTSSEERKSGKIVIEEIRSLRSSMSGSLLSELRIVIIEGLDMMTDQASNAFLKTLEELPERTLFLASVENIESLLMTVRSRSILLSSDRAQEVDVFDDMRTAIDAYDPRSPEVFLAFVYTHKWDRDDALVFLGCIRRDILPRHPAIARELERAVIRVKTTNAQPKASLDLVITALMATSEK